VTNANDGKPLSPYVGAHPMPAGSGGVADTNLHEGLPEPIHEFTSRPIVQSQAILTATDLHNVQHLLPILVKANPQLAPKPSTLPPHPTVAQVLTAIPFGFKMAYQQLQSPTPYGNQIAAYKIYKNQTANSFSGATLWETRPHDNAVNQKVVTLQDSTAGGGQRWYYFVSSVDTAGQESSPVAFQAGAITSQNANPNIVSPTPSTTSPSTASSSFSVIAEMTSTITTKGNPILLVFIGSFVNLSGSAAVVLNLAIFKDGVQLSPTFFAGAQANSLAAVGDFTCGVSYIDRPAAGSHTYDVRWAQTQSGGASVGNVQLARSFQIVELG